MPRTLDSRLLSVAAVTALVAACGLAGAAGAGAAEEPAKRPAGRWQTPREIQQPRGTWQVPGEIQKAGDVQRIEERCHRRLVLAADTLFAFDRADLSPQAEETLAALGPELAEVPGKTSVEGHTDAKGTDAYNRELSLRRAKAVRDWLVAKGWLAAGTPIVGFGRSKPVVANTHADGSDDPEGRRKNRRVEIVVETCPEE